jgi:pimeloyl-ACP methyl ester carboxylesterase
MPRSIPLVGHARAAFLLSLVLGLVTGCTADTPPENRTAENRTAAGVVSPRPGTIQGPSGRLHVDDGGQGLLPVVFVHSFAGSSAHWIPQLAHLRESRRAVALDLRGHGRSDPPASNSYAVDSLAADIAVVVDSLDLDRFVLVGHSMGGSAAMAYAGRHPEKVAGLVLVGAPGKSPPEMATQVLTMMRADYDSVTEGYWETLLTDAQPQVRTQVREDMKAVPQAASLAIIEAIFNYDPLPALQAYTGPKLIIDTAHGEGPGALHNQAPDVPRQVITGTSHWPHMDKPDEFTRILDEFLATAK